MTSRRPLYGWLAAEAISITGTRVSMIALPWFVLTTTGSAALTGLVAAVETAPMVLFKVLGGPAIDRLGARRVAITCDVGSLGVVGLIPLLYAAGLLHFGVFLGLVGLAGALRGPGDAAKHALVPALVAHGGVPTERATGLLSTVERTAGMLGAVLAGGLIAVVGAANALVIDALSFGIAALVLAWATTPLGERADVVVPEPAADHATYLRQLREGWDFLRGDRLLLGLAVMLALTNMLDLAYFSVLMPVWAEEYAGPALLGTVFAVWSGASAVGSICAAAWADRLPRFRVYLLAFLVGGAPRFAVFAFDSPLWLIVTVAVSGGFASGFLNPIIGAVVFERIPSPLVGRVSSLTTSMAFALMPVGGLLGGGLVTGFGLTATMLAVGTAYFAVTMLPALDPTWRQMDRRAPVAVLD